MGSNPTTRAIFYGVLFSCGVIGNITDFDSVVSSSNLDRKTEDSCEGLLKSYPLLYNAIQLRKKGNMVFEALR